MDSKGAKRPHSRRGRMAAATFHKPEAGSAADPDAPYRPDDPAAGDEGAVALRADAGGSAASGREDGRRLGEGDEEYEATLVPMRDIVRDPHQVRRIEEYEPDVRAAFDEGIRDLAADIEAHGLLTPIRIREAPVEAGKPFMVLDGERRFRAYELLGRRQIPASRAASTSDDLASVQQWSANARNERMAPMDEALRLEELRARLARLDGREKPYSWPELERHQAIRGVHKPGAVQAFSRLAHLPPDLQRRLLGRERPTHFQVMKRLMGVSDTATIRGIVLDLIERARVGGAEEGGNPNSSRTAAGRAAAKQGTKLYEVFRAEFEPAGKGVGGRCRIAVNVPKAEWADESSQRRARVEVLSTVVRQLKQELEALGVSKKDLTSL